VSACRQCGAPLRWETTARNGKPIPLDADPTPAGNVVMDATGRAVVLNDANRDAAVARGTTIYRAHFASCPNYERGRR
jgi:hypothetical protein